MRSRKEEKSARSSHPRLLTLAAGLLIPVSIVLVTCFSRMEVNSARFAALREGMTPLEIDEVLGIQGDGVWLNGFYCEPDYLYSVTYSENPWLPDFSVKATIAKGGLKSKELQKPTIRQILEYWCYRARQR